MNEPMYRCYAFEHVSGIKHDALGGAVGRDNANLRMVTPLDGEPAIDALAVGQETWCRALTEDTSKCGEAKRRKQKTPTPDRYVVERVS